MSADGRQPTFEVYPGGFRASGTIPGRRARLLGQLRIAAGLP